MSYIRVIPRDLFNEGNLLKCLGRVYINLETANMPHVELVHDGEAFDVCQTDDGELFARNVSLSIKGTLHALYRPLNARDAWPLFIIDSEWNMLDVFYKDGSFSDEFIEFIK